MTVLQRRPCIIGNWKMMGSQKSIRLLIKELADTLPSQDNSENIDVVICPPFPYIGLVESLIEKINLKKTILGLGAQDVSSEAEGPFTGEVASSMLADLGCRYVIVGHSERRQGLNETDSLIARKFKKGYDAGLIPILCVGETQAERTRGETLKVVQRQLEAVLIDMGPSVFEKALLAYEPVWAIGTGQTATPAQAGEVHAFLRSLFKTQSEDCRNQVRILYGGSVKASNAASLFAEKDIDGALVGGASLNAEEFLTICRLAVLSTL